MFSWKFCCLTYFWRVDVWSSSISESRIDCNCRVLKSASLKLTIDPFSVWKQIKLPNESKLPGSKLSAAKRVWLLRFWSFGASCCDKCSGPSGCNEPGCDKCSSPTHTSFIIMSNKGRPQSHLYFNVLSGLSCSPIRFKLAVQNVHASLLFALICWGIEFRNLWAQPYLQLW